MIFPNITTIYNIWKGLIKFITDLLPVIIGEVAGSCALIVIMVTICIVVKNKSNNDR